jgi:hypothetical protein
MMGNNLSKTALTAAAIAARLLKELQIPFNVCVGYNQIIGHPVSYPHVWLQTGDLITDLTFSNPARGVYIMGQCFGFQDGYENPSYAPGEDATGAPVEPPFSVPASSIPLQVLKEQAKNLDAYLAHGPAWMQAAIQDTLSKALDGSDKVTFNSVTEDVLASLAGPAPQTR